MATETERNWTAQVVIASANAGLSPHFKRLEAEIYRALARIDAPRDVRRYLKDLRDFSTGWRQGLEQSKRGK